MEHLLRQNTRAGMRESATRSTLDRVCCDGCEPLRGNYCCWPFRCLPYFVCCRRPPAVGDEPVLFTDLIEDKTVNRGLIAMIFMTVYVISLFYVFHDVSLAGNEAWVSATAAFVGLFDRVPPQVWQAIELIEEGGDTWIPDWPPTSSSSSLPSTSPYSYINYTSSSSAGGVVRGTYVSGATYTGVGGGTASSSVSREDLASEIGTLLHADVDDLLPSLIPGPARFSDHARVHVKWFSHFLLCGLHAGHGVVCPPTYPTQAKLGMSDEARAVLLMWLADSLPSVSVGVSGSGSEGGSRGSGSGRDGEVSECSDDDINYSWGGGTAGNRVRESYEYYTLLSNNNNNNNNGDSSNTNKIKGNNNSNNGGTSTREREQNFWQALKEKYLNPNKRSVNFKSHFVAETLSKVALFCTLSVLFVPKSAGLRWLHFSALLAVGCHIAELGGIYIAYRDEPSTKGKFYALLSGFAIYAAPVAEVVTVWSTLGLAAYRIFNTYKSENVLNDGFYVTKLENYRKFVTETALRPARQLRDMDLISQPLLPVRGDTLTSPYAEESVAAVLNAAASVGGGSGSGSDSVSDEGEAPSGVDAALEQDASLWVAGPSGGVDNEASDGDGGEGSVEHWAAETWQEGLTACINDVTGCCSVQPACCVKRVNKYSFLETPESFYYPQRLLVTIALTLLALVYGFLIQLTFVRALSLVYDLLRKYYFVPAGVLTKEDAATVATAIKWGGIGVGIVCFIALSSVWYFVATGYRRSIMSLRHGTSTIETSRFKLISATYYIGYQLAHTAVAYVFASVFFFFVAVFVVLLVLLPPLRESLKGPITNFFLYVVLPSIIVWFIRYAFIRVCFVAPGGLVRNRHSFAVFDYFMSFVNIVTGFAACLSRFGMGVALHFMWFWRLDISSFPSSMATYDPGYSAYVGMLLMDHQYNNPIAVVFSDLLLQRYRVNRKARCVAESRVAMLEYARHTRRGDVADAALAREAAVQTLLDSGSRSQLWEDETCEKPPLNKHNKSTDRSGHKATSASEGTPLLATGSRGSTTGSVYDTTGSDASNAAYEGEHTNHNGSHSNHNGSQHEEHHHHQEWDEADALTYDDYGGGRCDMGSCSYVFPARYPPMQLPAERERLPSTPRAVLRWQLAYTLVNNPALRLQRKHYIAALNARAESQWVFDPSRLFV